MQTNLPLITGLAALLAGTALPAEPAKAQVVGTAAAVNPLSQSTPPGRGTRVLHIGAEVLHQERIQTAASGTVQLLFIDKTTLSIGPNSILVIDNYVYDPASGTGQMATSLAKGMLRFVGGQLSHQGAATVRTPAAVVGIRGGIATIAQGAAEPGSSTILGRSRSPTAAEHQSSGAPVLPSRWPIGTVAQSSRSARLRPRSIPISGA